MKKDHITGIVLIVLGLLVMVFIRQIPTASVNNDVGPRLFPYISSIGIIICGIGIAIQGKKQEVKPYFTLEEWKRFATIFSIVVLYAILLITLGFLISTPFILYLTMRIMGQPKRLYFRTLSIAVGFTTFVFFIFEKILHVMLPAGKLF